MNRVEKGGNPDELLLDEIMWPELINNLGVLQMEVGKKKDACESFTEAIKLC